MTDDTLRQALATARGQHEEAVAEVARLTAELSEATERLDGLWKVVDALEDYLDDAVLVDDDEDDDQTPDVTPDETPNEVPNETPREGSWHFEVMPAPVRKKYPSTTMVAELVNDLGRPVNRDEIIHLFDERFGIPPSWNNPRNSLGNALLRAAEKGDLVRLDFDYYAPKGFRDGRDDGGLDA